MIYKAAIFLVLLVSVASGLAAAQTGGSGILVGFTVFLGTSFTYFVGVGLGARQTEKKFKNNQQKF